MKIEISCGAIVFTIRNGQILFVIVQEQSGAYSFPKGHMEGSETEKETAYREIFEEIGLKPVFVDGFREADDYTLHEKPCTRKHVVYFLAEYSNEPLIPQHGEIKMISLLPYEQAEQCFIHEGNRRILRAAHQYIMQLQLVRGKEPAP